MLAGSSFHNVEKGRGEMDHHSYKTRALYKPNPTHSAFLPVVFLLRDWEVHLLPVLVTSKYHQLHSICQDQRTSLVCFTVTTVLDVCDQTSQAIRHKLV